MSLCLVQTANHFWRLRYYPCISHLGFGFTLFSGVSVLQSIYSYRKNNKKSWVWLRIPTSQPKRYEAQKASLCGLCVLMLMQLGWWWGLRAQPSFLIFFFHKYNVWRVFELDVTSVQNKVLFHSARSTRWNRCQSLISAASHHAQISWKNQIKIWQIRNKRMKNVSYRVQPLAHRDRHITS